MPKSGKVNGRLGEVLLHLKELRASGKETVRKMNELEKKIEEIREQQNAAAAAARERGRRPR